MATRTDKLDDDVSANSTIPPLMASTSSDIAALFSVNEINTAYQLYELFQESGPRYIQEIGTESAELVLYVVGQNPKPARTIRSQALSQPFHTHTIAVNAERRQILRTWLMSTEKQLQHPHFLMWKKRNPNALSVFKLGYKKVHHRKSSTNIHGLNLSLVDIQDNFGKGEQQVQTTLEIEDNEQVLFSSLHFSLYSH